MREEEDREINHHGRSVNVGSGEENDEENEQNRRIFVLSQNISGPEDEQVPNSTGLFF